MEAVTATDRPSRDYGDHDLWHEPDQALDLKDVESSELRGINPCVALVLVSVLAPYPLIASRAECPSAVLWRGSVPGEEDAADVRGHPGVVEGTVELIDGLGAEGVADLGAVEGDPDGTNGSCAVVGDV